MPVDDDEHLAGAPLMHRRDQAAADGELVEPRLRDLVAPAAAMMLS
jgi:hypothetical protein